MTSLDAGSALRQNRERFTIASMPGSRHPKPLQSGGELQLPCLRCGTNLRAVSIKGNCPSCGLAVASTIRVGDAGSDVAESKRPCTTCGYDLRGVASDRCPECGNTFRRPPAPPTLPGTLLRAGTLRLSRADVCPHCEQDVRRQTGDRCASCGTSVIISADPDRPLTEMPLPFVRQVRTRVMLSSVLLLVAATSSIILHYVEISLAARLGGSVRSIPAVSGIPIFGDLLAILAAPMAPLTIGGLIAGGFVALSLATTAWITTPAWPSPEAVRNGLGPRSVVRRMTRAWSPLWALAALVCFTAAAEAQPAVGPIWKLSLVSIALAMIGLAPLALHLERIAAWMRDDVSERALHWSSFFAPAVAGVPLVALGMTAIFDVLPLLVVVVFAAIVGFYGFIAGMLPLPVTSFNLVVHAQEHVARLDRRADRDDRRAAEQAARLRAVDSSGRAASRPMPPPRGDPFDGVR